MEAAYPEPGVRMTQHNLGGSTIGDGGDQYVGIDRFGQLEEVRWHQTSNAANWKEHLLFGYNKAGNRLWRENLLFPNTEDELYAYDGLYQVTGRQRGNLSNDRLAIAGTPQRREDFGYDPLGNWTSYAAQANGSALVTQTRTHNQANQTTGIANTVPAGSVLGITHDAAGNMTQAPPDADGDWTKGFKLTWDAWNRLVSVRRGSDNTEVGAYQYDALFRRTARYLSSEGYWRHEYWDGAWRLVEENTGSATTNRRNYIWGLRNRNDLVCRDFTAPAGGSGSATSGSGSGGVILNTRHYVAYDWINPTAIMDRSGAVLERQSFSAFGQCRLLAPDGSERAASILPDWNFKFHGQFYDHETGWSNYGFRYYMPALGRWTRRDPISERDGANLYGMLLNNPLNWLDILGLAKPSCEDYEKNYPNSQRWNGGVPARQIYDDVGGWLDRMNDDPNNKATNDYQDSCALRTSMALNGCGGPHKIPASRGPDDGINKVPDGKKPKDNVIISAEKMCSYLEKQFGKPDYEGDADFIQQQADSDKACGCFCFVSCSDQHVAFTGSGGRPDSTPMNNKNGAGAKGWKLPCKNSANP